MNAKVLAGLTVVAVVTLIVVVAWRLFHFPAVYLFAALLLSWGGPLLLLGRARSLSRLEQWWTWRGALLWLGGVLVATGIVYALRTATGNPMTWEEWSQLALGFVLAYVLGFVLYHGFRRFSHR